MHQSRKKTSRKVSSPASVPEKQRETQWVVVGLTTHGEKEDNLETIRNAAYRILKRRDIEVFIPAISQVVRGFSETMFYMQGYIFIEFQENVSYLRLRETTYFSEVLYKRKGKKPEYDFLPNRDIVKLKEKTENLKFSHFEIGDQVTIIMGNFKNLNAVISYIYDESQVQVAVLLRSKKLLMDYPCTYLQKKTDNDDTQKYTD